MRANGERDDLYLSVVGDDVKVTHTSFISMMIIFRNNIRHACIKVNSGSKLTIVYNKCVWELMRY